ncbi:MAG: 2-keto-4-pentenoate hydratase [Hyphomonas sp.]
MNTELAEDIRARSFTDARIMAQALPDYPGTPPQSLSEAYAIQAQAIRLWPDRIVGWKVGKINPPWDAALGTDRLAGPIFARDLTQASDDPVDAFVFEGGFGAVEGEVIIVCGADTPAGKLTWTIEEAADFIGEMIVGAEIASSPFRGINDLGPLVTISDFGNNNGLILGASIRDWQDASPADWRFRTVIDQVEIGQADATSIPGGPIESFRALLEICAARGMPLREGMYVSTGAVTGVHAIQAGQSAVVEMEGYPEIKLNMLRKTPTDKLAQSLDRDF